MLLVVLPVVQLLPGAEGGGLHEDSIDTLHMLAGSHALRVAAAISLLSVAVYNIAGMIVTDSLGATTRTVLETTRTLFVWVVDLLLFYSAPLEGVQLGEPWTRHSWIQAVGFVVLVAGTLLYGTWGEIGRQMLQPGLLL